ncbi:YccV-like-domain-containing protein [Lophium mytilinum]|uniref:YccV-like-domain-containing protein n=1 Tax=Lophium mytilinum TaxID=390894 RepID=A0A6A6R6Y2_9PEZI|nr:YccV-like-domain-containing protein [Lophium mytilinum]
MATKDLSLSSLPTEILQAIFEFLPPEALVTCSGVSRRLKAIATLPALWRSQCQMLFKFWHARHHISSKLGGPLPDTNWQALFKERITADRTTSRLLQEILASQKRQIANIAEIAALGYDAKDALLRECNVPDDTEDVLARKFYANAALDRIHRELAINVWKDLAKGTEVKLERALAAYDMFTLGTNAGDIDDITRFLDDLARSLRLENPTLSSLSTREQALTLASFLRSRNYRGVSEGSYTALRNNFIGIVLSNEDHESLPLISVAIYCAVAERVGLDARPCGYPFHVYGIVHPPKGHTLDGKLASTTATPEHLYIDPFRSDLAVPEDSLRTMLRQMGIHSSDHSNFLGDASTRDLVLRTARNIMNSVQTIRQTEEQLWANSSFRPPSWLSAFPDMDDAFYATLWSMLILGPGLEEDGSVASITTRRRQYLPYLCDHFQQHSPWDVTLIEEHIVPMFYNLPEGQRLIHHINTIHAADAKPKPVSARSDLTDNVTYKVGQVFHHRRYLYEGVITGWDSACDAGEEWIRHMGVDRLSGGRGQGFYHVLVADKSMRYVAEENIEPVLSSYEPSQSMMKLAGRYFKRWDSSNGVFVSNIRDEYPDD